MAKLCRMLVDFYGFDISVFSQSAGHEVLPVFHTFGLCIVNPWISSKLLTDIHH